MYPIGLLEQGAKIGGADFFRHQVVFEIPSGRVLVLEADRTEKPSDEMSTYIM